METESLISDGLMRIEACRSTKRRGIHFLSMNNNKKGVCICMQSGRSSQWLLAYRVLYM